MDDFYQYALYHTISDFADLSLVEIITLQFIVRYSQPVVRHALFTEVKQFIAFKEKNSEIEIKNSDSADIHKFFDFINKPKNLSTGKFYYCLDKLEKRGLLVFDGKTGKVSVNSTIFSNYVPKLLLKFLINNNVMNSVEYREEFSKNFLNKIGHQHFKRILSLWLSEYVPLSVVNQISEFTEELYILSKNEDNNYKNNKLGDKIRFTEIIGGLFRERENFFDAIFIPVYKKNPKFYNMSRKMILKEVIRVTKPNGYIILVAIADFSSTTNLFINELIEIYKAALNNRIFTQEDLKNDLLNMGLTNIEVFEHQGLLIGIAENN
jgi:hypothetical protein